MAQNIQEVIMSRAELIYVLNALQASHIAGMELEEFSWPRARLDELLEEAEQSLIASSLLGLEGDKKLLDPVLVSLVGALAFRELAFVLVRGVRGKGQQLIVYNLYQDIMVEHTLPQEGLHRLAIVESLDDLLNRLQAFIPLQPVLREGRPQFEMSQRAFEQLRADAQAGKDGRVTSTLEKAGLDADLAAYLTQALENPLFTLSIACLACEGEKVVDASSVAIFADENSAWGIWPSIDDLDHPQLLIFPSGINDVKSAFVDWLQLREE